MLYIEKYLAIILLPSALIIICRWLFAFYFPINLGISFANFQNHHPIVPSQKALSVFNTISAILFLSFLIILATISTAPLISYFYHFEIEAVNTVSCLKILIGIYAAWFINSFATGYIHSHAFYDELYLPGSEGKFYFDVLDENYKGIVALPSLVYNKSYLLFDNEAKITKRINLHKSMAKDYKKQNNDFAYKALMGSVKIGEGEIVKFTELRKKHGHLSIFWKNMKEDLINVIFPFVMPPFSFYILIVESVISLVPSLRKLSDERAKLTQGK